MYACLIALVSEKRNIFNSDIGLVENLVKTHGILKCIIKLLLLLPTVVTLLAHGQLLLKDRH